MKRPVSILLLAVLTVAFHIGWGGKKKGAYEIDKAKLGSVKKIAVFSIYTPGRHSEGIKEKIDLQPFADAAEQAIVAGLAHSGYEVLPLDETRAAFQREYADRFGEALASSGRRRSERDRERIREMVRTSGVQHAKSGITGVKASRNTSFVFGTDEPSWMWSLSYTLDGHPVLDDGDPKAEHLDTAMKALGQIASGLGADAFVVARLRPTTAGTTGENKSAWRNVNSKLNPIAGIRDSIKTMKTGEYGAAILDFHIYDTAAKPIFADQVIDKSDKEVGNVGTAFKVAHGIGEEAATPLMKEAVDKTIRTTFQHLTGREIPSDLPGLGVGVIAEAKAAAEESARAAAAEAPARAAAAAGVYELATVAGKPLPYRNDRGFRYDSGTLELKSDGTFAATTVIDGRTGNYKGTYTITGGTVAFATEGNAFVRMAGPKNGEIGGDALTVFPGEMSYKRKQ